MRDALHEVELEQQRLHARHIEPDGCVTRMFTRANFASIARCPFPQTWLNLNCAHPAPRESSWRSLQHKPIVCGSAMLQQLFAMMESDRLSNQRQIKSHRRIRAACEPVVRVKRLCLGIFGIHN